mmetsp:Transcript_14014/g.35609  ORF Transcript_14014/g.35609 Transcript_14014/m.35609 type:complete len:90 (+) Transcript_14014:141-410(+)
MALELPHHPEAVHGEVEEVEDGTRSQVVGGSPREFGGTPSASLQAADIARLVRPGEWDAADADLDDWQRQMDAEFEAMKKDVAGGGLVF